MNIRVIFPTAMFILAGVSFIFGGWQYFQARAVASAAQQRLAFVITAIEKSGIARVTKQNLYASIMRGLPLAPSVFSLDFSGSFASQNTVDSCTSEGQRSICDALKRGNADAATMTNVCGTCNPL